MAKSSAWERRFQAVKRAYERAGEIIKELQKEGLSVPKTLIESIKRGPTKKRYSEKEKRAIIGRLQSSSIKSRAKKPKDLVFKFESYSNKPGIASPIVIRTSEDKKWWDIGNRLYTSIKYAAKYHPTRIESGIGPFMRNVLNFNKFRSSDILGTLPSREDFMRMYVFHASINPSMVLGGTKQIFASGAATPKAYRESIRIINRDLIHSYISRVEEKTGFNVSEKAIDALEMFFKSPEWARVKSNEISLANSDDMIAGITVAYTEINAVQNFQKLRFVNTLRAVFGRFPKGTRDIEFDDVVPFLEIAFPGITFEDARKAAKSRG